MSELVLDRIARLAIMYDLDYSSCLAKYMELLKDPYCDDPLETLELCLHFGF